MLQHLKPLRIYPFLIIHLFFILSVNAQRNETFTTDIKTLQVIVNDNWTLPPVMELQSNDFLTISFDHLTPKYYRYMYHIQHCNADWTPSDLSELDYLDGFNNSPIDDYSSSFSTTMLYTHYSLEIPNNNLYIKVSGNYIVTIYDDNEPDKPILKACFSVLEKGVTVSASVSSNTDIDTNATHQQVSFAINHQGYTINNPQSDLKIQVFQNQRWDNHVSNLVPTYITNGQLQYTHNRNLIFKAGNEYRRFELTEINYAMQGVDKVRYFDPYYHADLYVDEKRKNYSYDVDQNGRYFIRNSRASDSNTEADYIFIHFTLELDEPVRNGDLYLQGEFTNNYFDDRYKLTYNSENRTYESVQVLKQGAYNYQYLFVPKGGKVGETALVEGDFFETENEYMILVYHRPFGERYDKLIGMQVVDFKQ